MPMSPLPFLQLSTIHLPNNLLVSFSPNTLFFIRTTLPSSSIFSLSIYNFLFSSSTTLASIIFYSFSIPYFLYLQAILLPIYLPCHLTSYLSVTSLLVQTSTEMGNSQSSYVSLYYNSKLPFANVLAISFFFYTEYS